MYRKVSDGGQTLGTTVNEIRPGDIPPEHLQSFIACPQCDSEVISPCKCAPPNYTCTKCDWIYVAHRHPEKNKPTGLLHSYTLPH